MRGIRHDANMGRWAQQLAESDCFGGGTDEIGLARDDQESRRGQFRSDMTHLVGLDPGHPFHQCLHHSHRVGRSLAGLLLDHLSLGLGVICLPVELSRKQGPHPFEREYGKVPNEGACCNVVVVVVVGFVLFCFVFKKINKFDFDFFCNLPPCGFSELDPISTTL